MASDRGRFGLGIGIRLGVAFACIAAAAWMFGSTRLRVVPGVLVAAAIAQAIELAYVARRSAARIVSALDGWRSGELADRAGARLAGTGFSELGEALDEVTLSLREAHARAEEHRHYLEAIVGHAPMPLLVLDGRRVELANHAARRLLGAAIGSLDDLAALGDEFVRDLVETPPGEQRVSRMIVEGAAQRVLVSAGAFRGRATLRLLALESIEAELTGRTIEAWVEMARVLAHEIMGSLTPVASLAATAAQLLAELEAAGAPAGASPTVLGQAREATATVARRSEGLMAFVRRYRELAALPAPELAPLDLVELARGVATLFTSELRAAGIELVVEIGPRTLPLRGDRALLEQALINLVRNAADAVTGRPGACVWLSVRITGAGRTAIEVADNGPGVPAAMADQIFVPFFTTKRGGSGIGLSIAQHVAHAHAAAIRITERAGGGAKFTIVL